LCRPGYMCFHCTYPDCDCSINEVPQTMEESAILKSVREVKGKKKAPIGGNRYGRLEINVINIISQTEAI
jgi:hypothetical protein